MEKPTFEQVEKMLMESGKRGADTLSLLGQLTPFVEVFSMEIGRVLLKDDLDDFQRLLTLIYEETATEKDKAEFRVVKRRIKKNAERIKSYRDALEKIKT